MRQFLMAVLLASGVFVYSPGLMGDTDSTQRLIQELNQDDTIRGGDSVKVWKGLFDAYISMTPPPVAVGRAFNQTTIWPGMSDWGAVSKWAAENGQLADAIIKSSDRIIIGLPYGEDNVSSEYLDKGVYVEISVDGDRQIHFHYFAAVREIAAYCTAEIYRRFELGDIDGAFELLNAELWLLRMFCDRQFMAEKVEMIQLLTEALSNARDYFWTYQDRVSPDLFKNISLRELPYLRPERNRLLIPEADRLVAEVVLDEVFDHRSGDPIPDQFADLFTRLQSSDEPLTRFGAAARWRSIAGRHASHLASKERLQLIYDDWWRRWRIRNRQLAELTASEFDKANSMRYAAVLISVENIQELFALRNNLQVAVYGTAMSAALCAFKQVNGVYPAAVDKKATRVYGTYVSRYADRDPYNFQEDLDGLDGFNYTVLDKRTSLDVSGDRLWLEKGEALLYSYGPNFVNDRGEEHVESGGEHDIIIWPPVKSLLRQDGFLK